MRTKAECYVGEWGITGASTPCPLSAQNISALIPNSTHSAFYAQCPPASGFLSLEDCLVTTLHPSRPLSSTLYHLLMEGWLPTILCFFLKGHIYCSVWDPSLLLLRHQPG